ncbi:MAG: type III-B CRISPR module RAMP protein Cmr6 [Kiritimatiellaeota bacterium]|nr:type III-B CRISPR module RAMP protein Cmr6 [Kiritimatiellota bacterium]
MIVTATKEVLEALGGRELPRLTSPSLRLEKFVRLAHANKRNEIDAVVTRHNTKRDAFPKLFAPSALPGAVTLHLKLQYRLIVNQAGGILENAGLCLHRHFGFPCIPGSAVKGAARHAAWCRWWETLQSGGDAKTQALNIALTFGYPTGDKYRRDHGSREPLRHLDNALAEAEAFPDLFGENGRFKTFAGTVSFLPAWPADPKSVKLVTDIVNCHHPDYYSQKKDHNGQVIKPQPPILPGGRARRNVRFHPAAGAGSR